MTRHANSSHPTPHYATSELIVPHDIAACNNVLPLLATSYHYHCTPPMLTNIALNFHMPPHLKLMQTGTHHRSPNSRDLFGHSQTHLSILSQSYTARSPPRSLPTLIYHPTALTPPYPPRRHQSHPFSSQARPQPRPHSRLQSEDPANPKGGVQEDDAVTFDGSSLVDRVYLDAPSYVELDVGTGEQMACSFVAHCVAARVAAASGLRTLLGFIRVSHPPPTSAK